MEENKTQTPENTKQNFPEEKLPVKPDKKEKPEYRSSEWFKKNMPWAYQNL